MNTAKKVTALLLSVIMLFQLTACGFSNKVKDMASDAKDAIVEWYKGIDLDKFEDGWDAVTDWVGSAYAVTLSSELVQNVGNAINNFKVDMNSAYGSARGVAQEAGFAAEKWMADTFNIDAAARNSSYSANTVDSHDLASADVTTNYGEEASLKYYSTAKGSAHAQAKTLIKAYYDYYSQAKNPMSLQEYMDAHGYDYETESKLLPLYDGQTRIIPTDQMEEATAYLKGRITKLSAIGGPEAEQLTATYQQTLENLKDRLTAPDGTSSKPATYEEMQAVAELSQNGEFKPENFGFTLSQVITPKYILKQAVGTGLEVGLLKTVFTVGPDIFSIISEALKDSGIDEGKLKVAGLEGAIAMSEGFVEGSVSRVVVTICQEGLLGETLKSASPNVIGALVVLTINAIIYGYSLATEKITPEDYGNLMADHIFITALAIPTSSLFFAILPSTKLFMLAGCLAGGMVACGGYTIAKEAVLEFVDGGGFEAIVPTGIADGIESAKATVAKLSLSDHLSNLKEFAVTTAKDGYIKIMNIL